MIDLTSATFVAGGVAGLGIGALVTGWWVTARTHSRVQAQVLESGERAQRADALAMVLQQRVDTQQSEVGQLRQALAESQESRTKAETRMEVLSRSLDDQKTMLSQARQELHESFEALSGQALKQNNDAFLNLARASFETLHAEAKGELSQRHQAIGELVKPLEESLQRYQDQLQQAEQFRQREYGGLDQQLKFMAESHQRLQQETSNLVKALRAPAVRGRWGEMTLRRVAELAGMVAHCDFMEQDSVDSMEGLLRPDMVVYLPAGRQIVVDAKTVLAAYLDAYEAQDDQQRQSGDEQEDVGDHRERLVDGPADGVVRGRRGVVDEEGDRRAGPHGLPREGRDGRAERGVARGFCGTDRDGGAALVRRDEAVEERRREGRGGGADGCALGEPGHPHLAAHR